MTVLRFTLSCTPTAQARVRHAVRCGHSVAYKSAGQKSAEAVLDALLLACAPQKPLEGPLVLEFIAGMPIPASTPKRDREAMLRGDIGHTKKPDLDNLGKQLLDAMTRTGFWHDDKQVVSLHCSKRYAAVPGWEVAVYPVGGWNMGGIDGDDEGRSWNGFPIVGGKVGQGVKIERIRRITGYLVGTVDRFNDAKRAEVRDRVKHVDMEAYGGERG